MLHRQNLTPPPSIGGKQTLNLEGLDWGLDLLKDVPPPPATGLKDGDEEVRRPKTWLRQRWAGTRGAFRPCRLEATLGTVRSCIFLRGSYWITIPP
jgi:hypothetical protein